MVINMPISLSPWTGFMHFGKALGFEVLRCGRKDELIFTAFHSVTWANYVTPRRQSSDWKISESSNPVCYGGRISWFISTSINPLHYALEFGMLNYGGLDGTLNKRGSNVKQCVGWAWSMAHFDLASEESKDHMINRERTDQWPKKQSLFDLPEQSCLCNGVPTGKKL